MSRQRGSRTVGRGVVIPGCYDRINASVYRGVDPRIFVSPNDVPEQDISNPLTRALDAGEPVTVACWRVSNRQLRQQYSWLRGPGLVRVYPNDLVEAADAL